MTPAYQNMHLKPYITALDEEKLFLIMKEVLLRTKAMMRLAIRLGLRDIDICNLRVSQIGWQSDKIILEQEKTGVKLCLSLLEDVGNAIMDYIMNKRPIEIGAILMLLSGCSHLIKSSNPCTWFVPDSV